MTPGPKKKGFNKRGEDKASSHKRENVQKQSGKTDSEKSHPKKEELDNVLPYGMQNKSEPAMANNWDRYEEPVVDAHADVSRGDDFDVLLSYSSGAGSQLQLQDEREWDEFRFDAKSLGLDMGHLSNMLKCIPFHKRLGIPESVFNPSQIQNFEKCAENHRNSCNFTSLSNTSNFLIKEEPVLVLEDALKEKGEYIIEDDADGKTFHEKESSKVPFIHEKTENLIESLSSCLSSKVSFQESDVKAVEAKQIESPSIETDDLSYLLSLTTASNAAEKPKTDSSKKLTKSNVDEWLSSILDD